MKYKTSTKAFIITLSIVLSFSNRISAQLPDTIFAYSGYLFPRQSAFNDSTFTFGSHFSTLGQVSDLDIDFGPNEYLIEGKSAINHFVAQYYYSGELKWGFGINSQSLSNQISDFKQESDGDILFTGSFNDSLIIRPSNQYLGLYAQDHSPYLMRINNDGDITDSYKFNRSNSNEDRNLWSRELVLYPDNSYIITFEFSDLNGAVDLDHSNAVNGPTCTHENGEVVIAKYSSTDVLQWFTKLEPGATADILRYSQLIIDIDDNIVLTGSFEGSIDVDPSPNSSTVVTNINGGGIYTIKLSPTGKLLWYNIIEQNNYFETSYIGLLTNSRYILGFQSDESISISGGLISLPASTDKTTYVEYDSLGNPLNAFQIDGDFFQNHHIKNDTIYRAITPGNYYEKVFSDGTGLDSVVGADCIEHSRFIKSTDDNFLVTGVHFDTCTIQLNSGTLQLNGIVGNQNVFIALFDNSGSGSLGIKEFEANKVKVYPNPSSDKVKLTGLLSESHIEVYDVNGRCILRDFSSFKEKELDFSALENGIYILSVRTNSGTESHKLMIQK